MMRPTMVMILREAKQNSASPYIDTAKMLRPRTTTMIMVIQTAGELFFDQYLSNTSHGSGGTHVFSSQ